jgi:hypothetical protein
MAEGEFWKGHELITPISDQLREELTARSKDTLIQRLDKEAANKEHRASLLADSEVDTDEVDNDDDNDEVVEEVPYDKWTNAELIEEINERNTTRAEADLEPLPTNGKKAELVAVLEKDDEENESADE